jgi:tRNA/tmRNA/rRNA uracil-C5-methylase (TrmA/RlmC/RlmD family)
VAEALDLTGAEFELEVGAVAHGGHCVARIESGPAAGRVVFVRHALPGERVRVRITEDGGGSFCRGDAVGILRASPDRVTPPCPHAGPGRCGGCDWQHASGPAQRALKAAVVREQLTRLAGIDRAIEVEELPGGLLGWRTRTVYAVDRDGRLGLRRHRSHEIERLDACPLGVPEVGGAEALRERIAGADGVERAVGDDGQVAVLAHRRSRAPRRGRGRRPPDTVTVIAGPATLTHHVHGRDYTVASGGFWQVHPAAAPTFAATVSEIAAVRPGETVLDLYAGAGLFTALLAAAATPTGRVLGLESSRVAVADAASNLADQPQAEVRLERITAEVIDGLDLDVDVVVLDPPRAGAGPDVIRAVLDRRPRVVVYVACDPAALARDVAAAAALGWELGRLRAFDAFPMTAHVECVAELRPRPAGLTAES